MATEPCFDALFLDIRSVEYYAALVKVLLPANYCTNSSYTIVRTKPQIQSPATKQGMTNTSHEEDYSAKAKKYHYL